MQTQADIIGRYYATILDAYQNYLDSDKIYDRYWGFSEEPPCTADEFRQKQFSDLIDRINRVPFDSEVADKGTAFNEIVDCVVEKRYSDMAVIGYGKDGKVVEAHAQLNGRLFKFDPALVNYVADYYAGSIPQVQAKATIDTKHGAVEVYGYIDELLPDRICDIKTTSSYSVGKFRDHWQHIVYPYCIWMDCGKALPFQYDVVVFKKNGEWQTHSEYYQFVPERDVPRLRLMCEDFTDFLLENRKLITDKKIISI